MGNKKAFPLCVEDVKMIISRQRESGQVHELPTVRNTVYLSMSDVKEWVNCCFYMAVCKTATNQQLEGRIKICLAAVLCSYLHSYKVITISVIITGLHFNKAYTHSGTSCPQCVYLLPSYFVQINIKTLAFRSNVYQCGIRIGSRKYLNEYTPSWSVSLCYGLYWELSDDWFFCIIVIR